MRKFIVRVRHWQMFVVLVGVSALNFRVPVNPPSGVFESVVKYWVPSYVLGGCMLLWLWLLGSSLADIARATIRPKKAVFNAALLLAFIYMPIYNVVPVMPGWFLLTSPLDMLTACGLCYAFIFVVRSLIIAESGRLPSWKSIPVPFLMLLFFPVGIWFLQPRINRLFTEDLGGAPS